MRLVALTGASNVTGYRTPIHEAAALAHAYGALVSVDAAQLVAHHAIDMLPHGAPGHLDFLSFSGHKMYAPYGAGVLVAPARILDRARPLLAGGGTVSTVSRSEHVLVADADRHEAGSPNVVGAVAMAAAISGLRALGLERIARHERPLTTGLLEGLGRIPGVRVLGDPDPAAPDRGNVVTFVIDGVAPSIVTSALSTEWAVGARDGAFCAQPYMAKLMAQAGVRGVSEAAPGERCDAPGAVRMSVGPASQPEDIERALAGVDAIAAGRLAFRYRHDPEVGRVAPVGWVPDRSGTFQLPA